MAYLTSNVLVRERANELINTMSFNVEVCIYIYSLSSTPFVSGASPGAGPNNGATCGGAPGGDWAARPGPGGSVY